MKRSFILSVVILVLTACGEPTPTADYSQISKTQVQAYVHKISDAIEKTKTINLSDTTAMHDWSKVIDNLKQEGLQYGENVFSEPYGRCAKPP